MLSKERIRLMAKMAAYEMGEGKQNMEIGNYFRSDYISMQMIGAIISATISYIIILALIVFYRFEEVMKEIYQIDMQSEGRRILIAYVIFVGLYCLIAFIYYSRRYSAARKNLKAYNTHLSELLSLYDAV